MQGAQIRTSAIGGQDPAIGLNPTRPIGGHDLAGLMRLMEEKAQASIRVRSVDPLMEFVYARLMAGAQFVAHIPVACGKGCSFCCRVWVDATPPEVLYTAKSMPPQQRIEALQAVEQACSITTGVSFFDRCGKVNPPCPMLRDGACSVYEARPVNCRTLVSTDAGACRATFLEGSDLGFPGLKVWLTLQDSYAACLEGALMRAGLAYRAHELNQSLQIALTEPDAEERWLGGADAFASAPMSPASPIFESPLWRAIYQQAFGALPA